jgi:hypothetical protein
MRSLTKPDATAARAAEVVDHLLPRLRNAPARHRVELCVTLLALAQNAAGRARRQDPDAAPAAAARCTALDEQLDLSPRGVAKGDGQEGRAMTRASREFWS